MKSIAPAVRCTVALIMLGHSVFGQVFFDTTFLVENLAVHFDSNEALIKEGDSLELVALLNKAENYDSSFIFLRAHTDSDGGDSFNRTLSQSRAKAVYNILSSHEYDTANIQAQSFGETQPKLPNNSAVGKAANRRVMVELFAKQRMTWIRGKVMNDTIGQEGIEVFLYSKDWIDSAVTTAEGEYELSAPIKEEAIIEIRSDEHLPQFLSIEVKPTITKKPFNITLQPIEIGSNFRLLNLNFYGNRSLPLPGSRKTLAVVGQFLSRYEHICVEIQGHINHPGQPDVDRESKSYFLSVARARVVYDYLRMFHMIATDRMYYQGYGDWSMLFPEATSAREQRLNRRVEIHLCSCEDAKSLSNSKGSDIFKFYTLLGEENIFR